LAIFFLLNLLADVLAGMGRRLSNSGRRIPNYLKQTENDMGRKEQERQELQVMLYGWAGQDMQLLQLIVGGCGVLLVFLVFPTMPLLSPFGAALYFAPRILANQERERAKWRYLRQVRHLVDHLRLASDLNQSLTWGLRGAVDSVAPGKYLVFDRLRYHLERQGALEGPLVALRQVCREFHLPELEDLTDRLESARDGDEHVLRRTLHEATEDISQEIARQLLLHIEVAPVRLLMPIVMGLFPPVMLLAFYPTLSFFMAGFMR
jgi:hypothetical protein